MKTPEQVAVDAVGHWMSDISDERTVLDMVTQAIKADRAQGQGEASDAVIQAAVESDRARIRSTIGAFVDEGVWAFDGAVSTLEKHDAALRAAEVMAEPKTE